MKKTKHPDYPDGKLPQEIINELLEEPEIKEILKDSYIYHTKEIEKLNKQEKECQKMAQDPWVKDFIESFFTGRVDRQSHVRLRTKFHRLLMKASGVEQTKPKNYLSEEDIDNLKQIPIEDLIPLEDTRRRDTTDRISVQCPFHDDDTPSFIIYKDTNTAHCFGCGYNGDNIDIVMKFNSLTFLEACKLIKKNI